LPSFLRKYPENISCRALLSIAHAIRKDMESARRVLQKSPDNIKKLEHFILPYQDIIKDESIRNEWSKIFDEIANTDYKDIK
jgi:hypothetical protein